MIENPHAAAPETSAGGGGGGGGGVAVTRGFINFGLSVDNDGAHFSCVQRSSIEGEEEAGQLTRSHRTGGKVGAAAASGRRETRPARRRFPRPSLGQLGDASAHCSRDHFLPRRCLSSAVLRHRRAVTNKRFVGKKSRERVKSGAAPLEMTAAAAAAASGASGASGAPFHHERRKY